MKPAANCIAVATFLALVVSYSSLAAASRWTIRGRGVRATYVSVNQGVVTLKLAGGKTVRVPVGDFSDRDLDRLDKLDRLHRANHRAVGKPQAGPMGGGGAAGGGAAGNGRLNPKPAAAPPAARRLPQAVAAQRGAYSIRLQEQSLRLQSAQFWSQWYDLWVVQFQSRNGYFWVLYPARDSYTAERNARLRYPGATVMFVKRINR